jgi:hypothetical protein
VEHAMRVLVIVLVKELNRRGEKEAKGKQENDSPLRR